MWELRKSWMFVLSSSLPPSRLPNNLKAIVVSDPTTEKAAAALSVRVGAKHDPREAPGLAHFCEHMVRGQGGREGGVEGWEEGFRY
jgi:predicted Zn-dependent peptidase